MRVGLVTGLETIDFPERPDPEPEAGKAVVQISYCGICGTDLHAYQSGAPYNPAICGHEWTGVVSAVGPDVRHVKEGDRVACGIAPACGACPSCRAGDAAHCLPATMGMVGMGPLAADHGGFAPAINIDAARLYGVRDEIGDEEAALLEPATIAVHAVRRTDLRLGDSIVVIGAGPIGLLTLQCARAAGAGRVVVIEPDAKRAALALTVGADAVLDPTGGDLPAKLAEECGALGPDLVFECAGIPETVNQAVELVRRGGTVSMVGLANETVSIDPLTWLSKEARVYPALGYVREEFDVTMQLVADGRLALRELHTSTVALPELEGAFRRLLADHGEVKILVDPRLGD